MILAISLMCGVAGLTLLYSMIRSWLDRQDEEAEDYGAHAGWRPATQYREPIKVRTVIAVAEGAAEHEPLSWEQRQRVHQDHIAWQQRRVRALRAPTQAFDVIAANEGHPVAEHGPREADIVQPVIAVIRPETDPLPMSEWGTPVQLDLWAEVGK